MYFYIYFRHATICGRLSSKIIIVFLLIFVKRFYKIIYICHVSTEIKPKKIFSCLILNFIKMHNKLYMLKLCLSKFKVIYVLLICIYFTKEILEAFCLENIKIKFNKKGPTLEAILIQFAKIKLNSVCLDFENSDFIQLLNIDK